MDTVNVIVTCTKDKRIAVSRDCQLRHVPAGSLSERMKDWRSRLRRRWRERVMVRDLYAGDHWSTVRSFASSYFSIDTWICSAGFGLVRIDDFITPYNATFSSSHPDSVVRKLTGVDRHCSATKWWKHLTKWKADFQDRPRSLAALMATFPKRATVIVASNTYLRAIEEDLLQGIANLADPDLLSIVCSGAKRPNALEQHLVPCDARFQAATGGARRSLNTRIAARIFRESRMPPRYSTLRSRYSKLLSKQPPIEVYDRRPMSDDEVRAFIKEQMRADCTLRHSPLLRRLRDANKACEQKRFAKLYREVREQFNGN